MLKALTVCAVVALSFEYASGFSLRPAATVHGSAFSNRISALKSSCRSQGPRAQSQNRAGQIRMGFFDSLVKLAMPTEVVDTANSAPYVAPSKDKLSWIAGAAQVADPRHAMEDALFIAEKDFGLFDGVTGSRKASGQDLYSVQLCRQTQAMIESQRSRRGKVQVEYALEFAVGSLVDTMAVGSTTACVVTVDSESEPGLTLLRGVNVGDSGLTLCRRPAGGGPLSIVYKTNPQMHYFNCPFQLGGSSPDTPDQCVRVACPLAPGDTLVIASDGLYDNLFDDEILQVLERGAGQPPAAQAQLLVDAARLVQEDEAAVVPYGVEAKAAGQAWEGGKLDDTAVIVVQFYSGDQAPVPAPPPAPTAGKAAPLPKGWEEAKDPSTGQSYYYKTATGETTWTRPQ